MSNYNSQYESYYEKISKKRKDTPIYNGYGNKYSGYNGYDNKYKEDSDGIALFSGEYFIKRIIRNLLGTAFLFVFVLTCKLIQTPNSKAVYAYSKEMVSTDFDYKTKISYLKGIDIKELKEEIEDKGEDIISKLFKKENIKDKIKEEFEVPLKGEITSGFSIRKDPFTGEKKNHTGIDIDCKEGTEIKTIYKGRVKELGEDESYGKYVAIDHGDGIESKYAHLKEYNLEKDQILEKGDIIGQSGNTGKSTAPHLHFEFSYMGQYKDPLRYFDKELFKN